MSLRRTLNRKPSFHPLGEEDLKWLYAAYKQGADFGVDEDLEPNAFSEQIIERVWNFNEAWLLESGKPVGLVVGFIREHRLEPHVVWFPWSTLRQRLETSVKFINDLRDDYLILVYAEPESVRFFMGICSHGIMTRVGTIHGFFSEDRAAKMFRSIKRA